jgi:hypothetical protein
MRDLWNWVEAKAFNPRTERDKQAWLRCFHRSVHKIWGIEPDLENWKKPIKDRNHWYSDKNLPELRFNTLSLKPLHDSEIGFSYSIDISGNGFSVQLFYIRGCLQIHYDSTCLFEFKNDLNPNIDVNEITKEGITRVIKKRIEHPALHTHIKSEEDGYDYHNLRFGFATNNPFVILYQVAFQIIDFQNKDSEMKEIEVGRLAEILHSNRKKPEISAGILFPN